jgi:hypothetical protein
VTSETVSIPKATIKQILDRLAEAGRILSGEKL